MTSQDFLPDDKDKKLAGLVDAMMGTTVGKNRKAILTADQAVVLARARMFAELQDLPEVADLCDLLQDSTVSIKGKGLTQLVTVLSARMQANDDDEMRRLARLTGLGR